jgi:LysM repeat protein
MIYAVQEGNTLRIIAKKFNLTLSEIKTWNHLNEADRIHPEDRMKWRVGGIKSSTPN